MHAAGDQTDRLASLAGDLWNALCSVGHDGTQDTHGSDGEYCWPCAYVREYEDLTGIPGGPSPQGPLAGQTVTPLGRDRDRPATIHPLPTRRSRRHDDRERSR